MARNLRAKAKEFSNKLAHVKVLAFDVDGILTDGRIWYEGPPVGWNRAYHTRDGHGMKRLMAQGFKVAILTGGDSVSVAERFGHGGKGLGVDFIFSGSEDKMDSFRLLKAHGFEDREVLYMGDELFDLPVLKVCGFSATVPEACGDIKNHVDYVTETPGGRGAAREVMDLFYFARLEIVK